MDLKSKLFSKIADYVNDVDFIDQKSDSYRLAKSYFVKALRSKKPEIRQRALKCVGDLFDVPEIQDALDEIEGVPEEISKGKVAVTEGQAAPSVELTTQVESLTAAPVNTPSPSPPATPTPSPTPSISPEISEALPASSEGSGHVKMYKGAFDMQTEMVQSFAKLRRAMSTVEAEIIQDHEAMRPEEPEGEEEADEEDVIMKQAEKAILSKIFGGLTE